MLSKDSHLHDRGKVCEEKHAYKNSSRRWTFFDLLLSNTSKRSEFERRIRECSRPIAPEKTFRFLEALTAKGAKKLLHNEQFIKCQDLCHPNQTLHDTHFISQENRSHAMYCRECEENFAAFEFLLTTFTNFSLSHDLIG